MAGIEGAVKALLKALHLRKGKQTGTPAAQAPAGPPPSAEALLAKCATLAVNPGPVKLGGGIGELGFGSASSSISGSQLRIYDALLKQIEKLDDNVAVLWPGGPPSKVTGMRSIALEENDHWGDQEVRYYAGAINSAHGS